MAVVVLLSGTPGKAAALPRLAPNAKWPLMIYMAGANNLEPYITSDIVTELAPAGSNADVQIVALANRSPAYDASAGDWTGTLIFHVTKNMQPIPANVAANLGHALSA